MSEQPTRAAAVDRRGFIKAGILAGGLTAVAAGAAGRGQAAGLTEAVARQDGSPPHPGHSPAGTVGQVDHAANGFDPHVLLHDWDYGQVSTLPTGQILREYVITASDKEIEVAPGVFFPAWVYNGRVPGPTIRAVEGDRIRIEFINASSHPHTIHFHGIHAASMDGVPGVGAGMIEPGDRTIYEFDALPKGCHLYHCHSVPLKRHIHKGLYGAFIVDPDPNRYSGEQAAVARSRNPAFPENQAVNEMVMVMNAFDTNFDGDNEIYAVNTVAFAYANPPIRVRRDQLQRIYLINITEFDPINSFHLHANFFDYFDHGTTLHPTLKTVDTIQQVQGQRGILEISFEGFEPGLYMFHAHVSEFAELGWMGFFDVVE
jgi:FtsP/CotA-like multicopper oxidase with cupredoxin domain